MTKKQYHFLWGQRQSSLLTEASVNAVAAKGILMNEHIREHLQVVRDGVGSSYMTDEGIADWRENSKKYFNRSFTEQ